MKPAKIMFGTVIALLALALSSTAMAEEKEKTLKLTGDGKCGKCALKETEKCQNVIQVEKEGKKVTYYLVDNEMSKAFHSNICTATKKVNAEGTVKEVDGKKQLTVTKLELAK